MGKAKTLKAIPTTYKGIQFRSKLEAKYARAFDKLGIVWIYEGGGFLFDDGTAYCPDFYMPDMDTPNYTSAFGALDFVLHAGGSDQDTGAGLDTRPGFLNKLRDLFIQ